MKFKVGDLLIWAVIDSPLVIVRRVIDSNPNFMRYVVTEPGGGCTWEVSEEYLTKITKEDELYLIWLYCYYVI